MIGLIRKVLAHFGIGGDVAKRDALYERADHTINRVDSLRVHVVTKDERRRQARMNALDLQVEAQRRK